ncbi:metallophosphoesterase [Myxococcota bacterium]|nr:metallophosphoesterase [Myxococcota bacterium]
MPAEPSPVPSPPSPRRILSLLGLALAACGSAPAPAPAPVGAPPARVVAVGDLHGDPQAALDTLRLAGLVDAEGRWAGGAAVLVQTGDTTDRGPSSRAVLELMVRLQQEAAAAGGQVVALLGNHEVMNLQGDWRYVSEADLADFGGEGARRAALAPEGALGRWLREQPAVARVGDTVFVHGGVRPAWAALGVDGLAAAVDDALEGRASPEVLGDEGPLWYRGYLLAPEPVACAELGQALVALGARRMVVGHTTQKTGRIAARCGGQLLAIDTGISGHYGGNRAALELRDGDARALYPEGPQDLPDP